MSKIDFQHFKVFTDITKEKTVEQDLRRVLADSVYKNMNGIAAHDLALRIYRSEGSIDLTDEDVNLLRNFLKNSTPIIMDSFEENIKGE